MANRAVLVVLFLSVAALTASARDLQQAGCEIAGVAAKGCVTCNAKTGRCSACAAGRQLVSRTADCRKRTAVCCNAPPSLPKLSPLTVRVGGSVSIDLLAGVSDDGSTTSVALRRYSTKWGTGRLTRAPAAKSASVFVFAPTSGPGQLKLTYDVRDALNATATGSVVIRILDNSPPDVIDAVLAGVVAGVTVQYTTRELLSAMEAFDPDKGDVLDIAKIELVTPDLGDQITFIKSIKGWNYYCASWLACATSGGQQLRATVTDGALTATAIIDLPLSPRPELAVPDPVQLEGSESAAIARTLGPGSLERLGFELNSVGLADSVSMVGEVLEEYVLPVKAPDKSLLEWVEFQSDINQESMLAPVALSAPVGTVAADTLMPGIVVPLGGALPAAGAKAPAKAARKRRPAAAKAFAAAVAGGQVPAAHALAVANGTQRLWAQSGSTGAAKAAAVARATACTECFIDELGICQPPPASVINGDPTDCDENTCFLTDDGSCTPFTPPGECDGCSIDEEGVCVPDYGGDADDCEACTADESGTTCVPYGDGDPDGPGGDGMQLHAWLVPPVQTTAFGFWASLGCGKGAISVEFDAANADEYGGTLEGPRPAAGVQGGPRRLLHQSAQRLLLQDRPPNGLGESPCYNLDTTTWEAPPVPGGRQAPLKGEAEAASGTAGSNPRVAVNDDALPPTVVVLDAGAGAAATVAGPGRRLLRSRFEKESNYCSYYARSVTAEQEVDVACSGGSSTRRHGAWFSGHVANEGGYIRQVRIQVDVAADGDPTIYLSGIVMSYTTLTLSDDG